MFLRKMRTKTQFHALFCAIPSEIPNLSWFAAYLEGSVGRAYQEGFNSSHRELRRWKSRFLVRYSIFGSHKRLRMKIRWDQSSKFGPMELI